MKKRAVSLLLTTLAVVSFVLPALAAAPPELEVEPVEGFIQEERVEVEEAPAIRLDGEPMQSVEYEILNGVCYVTVSSFVSMLDPEAMVEEENGIVTVNASTVVEVVDVAEGMEPAANVVEETLNMTAEIGRASCRERVCQYV